MRQHIYSLPTFHHHQATPMTFSGKYMGCGITVTSPIQILHNQNFHHHEPHQCIDYISQDNELFKSVFLVLAMILMQKKDLKGI